jgi:hypothetical protein
MTEGDNPERCNNATTDSRTRAGTVEKKWIQSLDGMLKPGVGYQVNDRPIAAAI